jgi:endonuclease YncB( thermonuclease family)
VKAAVILAALTLASPALAQNVVDGDTIRIGAARFHLWGIDAPEARQTCGDGWQAGAAASQSRRTMEDRTMKTYTVTYNVTLTIEVQADSADEAERLAERELPSHCDVNYAVSCHRIATSTARTSEDN